MADYKLLIEALKQYHDSEFTPKVYEHSIFGVAALTIENLVRDINVLTKEQPEWIPVTEKLPETWQRVLAFREGYGILSDVILSGGEWCGDLDTEQAVTYWMPLPQPPKGDG